jgi:hypothetical protein
VTGTNTWQPPEGEVRSEKCEVRRQLPKACCIGPSPTVIQQPLDGSNRFYRAAWLP